VKPRRRASGPEPFALFHARLQWEWRFDEYRKRRSKLPLDQRQRHLLWPFPTRRADWQIPFTLPGDPTVRIPAQTFVDHAGLQRIALDRCKREKIAPSTIIEIGERARDAAWGAIINGLVIDWARDAAQERDFFVRTWRTARTRRSTVPTWQRVLDYLESHTAYLEYGAPDAEVSRRLSVEEVRDAVSVLGALAQELPSLTKEELPPAARAKGDPLRRYRASTKTGPRSRMDARRQAIRDLTALGVPVEVRDDLLRVWRLTMRA
jgi:hypothetical protein